MNQEKMKMDLISEVDDYYMQFIYWKDLIEVEKDIRKYGEKLSCSPNFKLIISCALEDEIMYVAMKLYDKSKTAKTIPNLVEKCKKNISLFQKKEIIKEKLEEFEKGLEEDEFISEAIIKLRMLRDSLFAHNDNKYYGKKLEKENINLKNYHIGMLYDYTEKILNFIIASLGGEKDIKEKYNGDLKNIFQS